MLNEPMHGRIPRWQLPTVQFEHLIWVITSLHWLFWRVWRHSTVIFHSTLSVTDIVEDELTIVVKQSPISIDLWKIRRKLRRRQIDEAVVKLTDFLSHANQLRVREQLQCALLNEEHRPEDLIWHRSTLDTTSKFIQQTGQRVCSDLNRCVRKGKHWPSSFHDEWFIWLTND